MQFPENWPINKLKTGPSRAYKLVQFDPVSIRNLMSHAFLSDQDI